MTFAVKDWEDEPSEETPIDAAALEDLENRLALFSALGYITTPEQHGAKGDLKYVMDGGIISGNKSLSSAAAAFTQADVGKTVCIRGAGTVEHFWTYTSTITTVVNATNVILADSASTTVSNAVVVYGTDDTQAFRDAIAEIFEKGTINRSFIGELLAAGRYMIAGSPILGGATKGFSQIPLPIVDSRSPKFIFTISAPGWGAPIYHWNQLHPQIAGGTLFSPLVAVEADGEFHAASVIGGPTNMGTDPNGSGGNGFSNICFGVKGALTIMLPRNPKHIAMDLRQMANADIQNLACLTNSTPGEMWTDVTSEQFAGFSNGLRLPEFFNNDLSRVTSLTVEGFSFGVVTGDHCVIDRLATIYCNNCLYTNPGGLQHGLSIANWSAEYSQHILFCEGQTGAKYPINVKVEVEEVLGNMLNDPENSLYGRINYSNQNSSGPSVIGCKNVSIYNENQARGVVAPKGVPASGSSLVNDYYRDASFSIMNGTGVKAFINGVEIASMPAAAEQRAITVPSGASLKLSYTEAPTFTSWILT